MRPWPLLSDYIADEIGIWAWCGRDMPCGHRTRLDLQAVIDRHGDVRLDELRRRLKCKCGWRGGSVSLIPYGELRGTEIMQRYRERNAGVAAEAVEMVRRMNAVLAAAADARR